MYPYQYLSPHVLETDTFLSAALVNIYTSTTAAEALKPTAQTMVTIPTAQGGLITTALTDAGLMSTAQPGGDNTDSTGGVNHHSANRCRVNVNSTAGGTIPTAQEGLITTALADVGLMSTAQPEGDFSRRNSSEMFTLRCG